MAVTSAQIPVIVAGLQKLLDVDANLFGMGTVAARPASGDVEGDLYFVNDDPLYALDIWDGAAWVRMTILGPTSSVDNRIARFDGTTGAILQNSAITLDDSGNITGVGTINGASPLAGPASSVSTEVLARWSGAADAPQGSGVSLNDARQMTGLATASFRDVLATYVATTTPIDWNAGASQWLLIQGNVTLTFTAPPAGSRLMLRVVQDATGSRTITWPSSVRWTGGSAPTLSTTAGDVDVVTFFFDGRTYIASASAAYAKNLVQELADGYSSILLWGHDETAGTAATDYGPNGDDGTYTTVTVNQTGLLPGDLKSVTTSTTGYANVAALTGNVSRLHSVLALDDFDTSGVATLFDIDDATNRQALRVVSTYVNFSDGADTDTGRRDVGLINRPCLYGYVRTASDQVTLYENGHAWRTLQTGVFAGATTPEVSHGATAAGGSASDGNYSMFGIFNAVLTTEDVYDIWQQYSGQRLFWHEFVVPHGLDASCVRYLTLAENDGTQFLDVSGNVAHAAVSGTLTYRGAALDAFHEAAPEGDGTTDYIACSTGNTINVATTTTWTIAGLCRSDADGDGIFSFGGSGNLIGLGSVATGNLQLYMNDGAATSQSITKPSGTFGWCVRRNGTDLDWWINGEKQVTVDLTGNSLTTSTSHDMMYWTGGAHSTGSLDGKFQHRGTYNVAARDIVCARLSEISPELEPPADIYDVFYDAVRPVWEDSAIVAHFSMDDASGSVLTDKMGTNGTISGSPTMGVTALTEGRGSAITWGSPAYGLIGSTRWNHIHQTGDYTVLCWVNFSTVSGTLLGSSTSTSHKGFRIDISAGKIRCIITSGAVSKTLTSTTSPATSTTYLVALTGDGTDHYLYINGIEEATTTVATATGDATNTLTVGAYHVLSGHLTGTLDELTFLNRGATAAEIQQYYSLASGT